jgi:hypothetical protein
MGQLDRKPAIAPLPHQRMGLAYDAWLRTLDVAHHNTLMPYQIAEIEECSIELDDALSHGDLSSAVVPPWRWNL